MITNILYLAGIVLFLGGIYMIYCAIRSYFMRQELVDVISYMGGMSYSLNDESNIMKKMRNQTMEEIAEYADVVCRKNAKNEQFLKDQLSQEFEWSNPAGHNPTSLGKIAYLAVHSPEPYGSQAKQMFNDGFQYFKDYNLI